MFLLAHVGITLVAGKAGIWVLERVQDGGKVHTAETEAANNRRPTVLGRAYAKIIDFRFLLVGSMLPDLIDKPLGMVILPQLSNGRAYAHTLLFALVLLVGAIVLPPRARPAAFALFAGDIVHLALDGMWQNSYVLLWPIRGFSFPHGTPMSVGAAISMFVKGLVTEKGIQETEALGALLIVVVLAVLVLSGRMKRFISEGEL